METASRARLLYVSGLGAAFAAPSAEAMALETRGAGTAPGTTAAAVGDSGTWENAGNGVN
jgi:hypothetical protein